MACCPASRSARSTCQSRAVRRLRASMQGAACEACPGDCEVCPGLSRRLHGGGSRSVQVTRTPPLAPMPHSSRPPAPPPLGHVRAPIYSELTVYFTKYVVGSRSRRLGWFQTETRRIIYDVRVRHKLHRSRACTVALAVHTDYTVHVDRGHATTTVYTSESGRYLVSSRFVRSTGPAGSVPVCSAFVHRRPHPPLTVHAATLLIKPSSKGKENQPPRSTKLSTGNGHSPPIS